MGGICQCWPLVRPSTRGRDQPNQLYTDRPLTGSLTHIRKRGERVGSELGFVDCNRVNSMRADTHNNFSKMESTGIGGNESDRKQSSIIMQGSSIEPSRIILKGSLQNFAKAEKCPEKYYTLIEKVIVIKKSEDRIRVTSPQSSLQLNCHPESILPTFYVCEGLPLDSLKLFNNKYIIQNSDSPIQVTLFLKCKGLEGGQACGRRLKLFYAKGIINTRQIKCDKCGRAGDWVLENNVSNVPIWGNGHKIGKGEKVDPAPEILRTFGCIMCMKYLDCKVMNCGCLICHNCERNHKVASCQICKGLQ